MLITVCGITLNLSVSNIYSQEKDTLKPCNILILFSLEPESQVYRNIIQGLKEKIRSEYPNPVNFFMDYVELSRFNDDQHLSDFFSYYNKKYSGYKFDLFISMGPNLYPLLKKYRPQVMDSVPVIYMETYLTQLNQNRIVPGKNETIVFSDYDIEKITKIPLTLFPETKNVFIVAGSSNWEKGWIEMYKSVIENMNKKYNITVLSGLELHDLVERSKYYPENSVVFMLTYQKDVSGLTYYGVEVIKKVAPYANAPIFQMYDVGMEYSVGGYIINTVDVGKKVGEVSVRILNGESPESIGIYHSNFSENVFNYSQLKKWKIDEKSLPENSKIMYREYNYYDQYKYYILGGLIFIIFETLLIFLLIVLNRKQKNQSRKIIEQENRYQTLVDYNRLSELSELTASLSHQLNQPLTAILSTAQASLRFIKNNQSDKMPVEEIMNNIVEDVKRASEIMNSLRSMIKQETREKKRVNINKITREVFLLFISQAAVRDVIASAEYDDSEPFVFADPILIQQVILNLLLNALEALENFNIKPQRIFLKTEVSGDDVIISVKDNGPGIPDNLKVEIFKPFFTTKKTGLGIGLAICRSIIEDHKGKLIFENIKPNGSVFKFNLKLYYD